jgi:hypothetical protein
MDSDPYAKKDFRRMPVEYSTVLTQESLVGERNWNDKFAVMGSKNNKRVHNNYKEYFDKPIDFDVKGYLQ